MGAQLPFLDSGALSNPMVFQNVGHRFWQEGIELYVEQEATTIVICGHSDCDFLRFLATPCEQTADQREFLTRNFSIECSSVARHIRESVHTNEADKWRDLSRWAVLRQLNAAVSSTSVSRRVEQEKLKLFGWLYDAETKRLEVFDPALSAFVTI
jgi:carbonic anhydrase